MIQRRVRLIEFSKHLESNIRNLFTEIIAEKISRYEERI